ncbi:hypothetical protein NS31R_18130 [Enterobacter cancerogenus]|nr:hypothetical protein ENTCAN_06259 [Enterobacter cancerogenus ATCC 35316]KTQ50327.1 hypothetical protein NS104_02425 [Enterobacter cancerogenus]KTQ54344.1 hypothetical protein NS111_01300 [Enterobacter cancerogenus]KTQ68871.1 hypothetical protein NS188_21095 [Enterobacter cancerogenus]KTQ78138.1 hypothetical protein NS31R_18130 [Enterobacter cancerogenus]
MRTVLQRSLNIRVFRCQRIIHIRDIRYIVTRNRLILRDGINQIRTFSHTASVEQGKVGLFAFARLLFALIVFRRLGRLLRLLFVDV